MEQFYKDPRTPLRMREGPLGGSVDELARQLGEEGYARGPKGRFAPFAPPLMSNVRPLVA